MVWLGLSYSICSFRYILFKCIWVSIRNSTSSNNRPFYIYFYTQICTLGKITANHEEKFVHIFCLYLIWRALEFQFYVQHCIGKFFISPRNVLFSSLYLAHPIHYFAHAIHISVLSFYVYSHIPFLLAMPSIKGVVCISLLFW